MAARGWNPNCQDEHEESMEGKWRKLLEYSIISGKEMECGSVEQCSLRKRKPAMFPKASRTTHFPVLSNSLTGARLPTASLDELPTTTSSRERSLQKLLTKMNE